MLLRNSAFLVFASFEPFCGKSYFAAVQASESPRRQLDRRNGTYYKIVMAVSKTSSSADRDPHAAKAGFDAEWAGSKRIWRRLMMPLYCFPDTGLLGLTPLRLHILICGFPRSGTTLLQMMLENGLPEARRFGYEVGGWRAATYSWRNHAMVISKVPHDVFRLQALKDFYKGRKAQLRIILMVRDPRDVLTSQRKTGGPKGYVVGPQRWRDHYQAFVRWQNDPDAMLVRYEDLVSDVDGQQARVEAFTGEKMSTPFSHFHDIERPDFDTQTLNGLRPVEQSLLFRWAGPDHHARIEEVLREMPDLPQILISLGYEPDDSWIERWRHQEPAHVAAVAQ